MTDSDLTISRRKAVASMGTAGLFGLAGCTGGSGGGGGDTVRAAWVYNSQLIDVGWTRAHEQGRQAAIDETGDWLETDYTEEVPVEDARQVMEQYVSSGYDIIFGCTFGYMDTMNELAEEYPDTLFEHCSGYLTRENLSRYYARLYQARFLNGVAAGHLTETNTIGYVASFPIAEVIRQINAFALGAAVSNPDVTLTVRYVQDWYAPSASGDAINALTDAGADVSNNSVSSTTPFEASAENEMWAFGYNTSWSDYGGDWYAGSALYNWGPYYTQTLQQVNDSNWEESSTWKGLEAGYVDVETSSNVPDDVASDVQTKRDELINGDRTVWQGSKFGGESDKFLFQDMGSYADGLFEGSVPES